MRRYIFKYEQPRLVALGLNLKHALLLDYIESFSGSAHVATTVHNNKKFYLITYKKIRSDLPILGVSTSRQVFNLIHQMENSGILETLLREQRLTYVRVVPETYLSLENKIQPQNNNETSNQNNSQNDQNSGGSEKNFWLNDPNPEKNFLQVGKNFLAIVSMNRNNKIIINIKEGRPDDFNMYKFLLCFKDMLKVYFSPFSYELVYQDMQIEQQGEEYLLSTSQISMAIAGKERFLMTLKKTFKYFLKITDDD